MRSLKNRGNTDEMEEIDTDENPPSDAIDITFGSVQPPRLQRNYPWPHGTLLLQPPNQHKEYRALVVTKIEDGRITCYDTSKTSYIPYYINLDRQHEDYTTFQRFYLTPAARELFHVNDVIITHEGDLYYDRTQDDIVGQVHIADVHFVTTHPLCDSMEAYFDPANIAIRMSPAIAFAKKIKTIDHEIFFELTGITPNLQTKQYIRNRGRYYKQANDVDPWVQETVMVRAEHVGRNNCYVVPLESGITLTECYDIDDYIISMERLENVFYPCINHPLRFDRPSSVRIPFLVFTTNTDGSYDNGILVLVTQALLIQHLRPMLTTRLGIDSQTAYKTLDAMPLHQFLALVRNIRSIHARVTLRCHLRYQDTENMYRRAQCVVINISDWTKEWPSFTL